MNKLVDVEHPLIQHTAIELVTGTDGTRQALQKLFYFVRANIQMESGMLQTPILMIYNYTLQQ